MRCDIAIEIHSLIMDALEDRTGEEDVDEQTVLSVLPELGSPIEMAGAYHPHNYVIGPPMYAPFWMTVRWAFILMTGFYLLGFALSWWQASQTWTDLGRVLWDLASGYWDSPAVIGLTETHLILNSTHPEAIQLTEETRIPIFTTIVRVMLILHLVVKIPRLFIKVTKVVGRPETFIINAENKITS